VVLGLVRVRGEKNDARFLRDYREALAVGPGLDQTHVLIELRGKSKEVRRRSAGVDVIGKGMREREFRKVGDKVVKERRRKNRSGGFHDRAANLKK
jgi:hypothetical protein